MVLRGPAVFGQGVPFFWTLTGGQPHFPLTRLVRLRGIFHISKFQCIVRESAGPPKSPGTQEEGSGIPIQGYCFLDGRDETAPNRWRSSGEFRLLMHEIRRKWRVTDMHLKRIVKEVKTAFPSFYGPAFAESVSLMSSLGRIWRNHLNEGGANPSKESRDDLLAAGLPVAWFPRFARG